MFDIHKMNHGFTDGIVLTPYKGLIALNEHGSHANEEKFITQNLPMCTAFTNNSFAPFQAKYCTAEDVCNVTGIPSRFIAGDTIVSGLPINDAESDSLASEALLDLVNILVNDDGEPFIEKIVIERDDKVLLIDDLFMCDDEFEMSYPVLVHNEKDYFTSLVTFQYFDMTVFGLRVGLKSVEDYELYIVSYVPDTVRSIITALARARSYKVRPFTQTFAFFFPVIDHFECVIA